MKMQEKSEFSTKSKKSEGRFTDKQRFLLIGIIIGVGFSYFLFSGPQNAEDSRYFDQCTELINDYVTRFNELVNGKHKYSYATVPLTEIQSDLNKFLREYNDSFERERSGE